CATKKKCFFQEQYGRQYRNLVEERKRFSLFKQALRRVEEHNAKYEAGESTYYKGINQFSDRSVAELSALFNTSRANRPTFKADVIYQKPENVEVADSVNWKDEGVVTEVKDQGQCGSCWAFSVTGALEGQYGIKYGSLVSLSEQDLMDCATDYGTYGCDGGWMDQAYGYVRDYGIESESDYPYEETQGSCRHSSSVLTVKSHVSIPEGDEDSLKSATASAGPISVSIYADTMFDYAGGVFNDACDGDYDHGVLVVGYGTDGSDYWLVKNSWGSAWGESGYMKIARNSNNKCSIASYATYPTIN
ncbi:hypothetical protein NQ318_019730, partial [Aromia moschata]